MSFPSRQPIDDLILVLLQQTQSGQIRWEPADMFHSAYIAKRPSGTVVLRGGPGGVPVGVSLQVKDPSGRTVEEAATGLGIAALGGRAQLATLYRLVSQQAQLSRQAIAKLADEFRRPD